MNEMEQIGRYWDLVLRIHSLITLACTGYLLYRFVRPYGASRRAAALAGAAYTAVMMPLYLVPWELQGMFVYAAGTAAAFVLLFALEREKLRQKLFLGFLMYLLDWIASGITNEVRGLLLRAMLRIPSLVEADPWRSLGAYSIVEVLCTVVRFLTTTLLIWIINRIYVCKKEDMDNRELVLMLITPLLVCAGYGTFVFTSETYLADLGKYIWETNPAFSWIKVGYQLLSYLALIVQLAFYQRIKDSHKKEKEAALLAGQIADMKKHIDEVEGLYREIRGIRHDVGNHLMIMEQLVSRQQPGEAAAYLRSWRSQTEQVSPAIRTGNPVTDVVLAQKQRRAKELGVELVSEFWFPEGMGVDVFDISILLSNALDNAVDNTPGNAPDNTSDNTPASRPVVQLRSWRRKNVYLMEVSNPFCGTLAPEGRDGLPKSTKEGPEHGFGLANMRRTAQRYYGDLEIRVEDGRFVLTVMLQAEQEKM